MRKLSNRWKEKVKNGMDVQYLKYADITLTNGTVLNLTSANLWQNGMEFEDSVSGDSSFDIGSAIINVLNLSINNFDGEYSDYDFEGAEVICYVGLQIEDEDTSELLDSAGEQILDSTGETIIVHKNAVIEKARICTATVVEQPEDETVTIDLTCEDNMRKFDRNYSDSKLKYPATRGQIVRDACEVCGVTLQTTSFDRDDYIVQNRPNDEALTFRQVLQWVAQIGCQWMRCDEYGRLCINWYGGSVDEEELGTLKTQNGSNIKLNFSSSDGVLSADNGVLLESNGVLRLFATDGKGNVSSIKTTYGFTPHHTDVVVTGVKVTEYSDSASDELQTYMDGTEGYVLTISDNKLICKGDGQTVASIIAEKCVGMRFRPFESECPTDVALEAGDSLLIVDRTGKIYNSFLTSTTLQPGAGQRIACNAKSAAKNSSTRYSQATQAFVAARNMVKQEKTEREKALEEFGKRIDSATGVYTTEEIQEDGSRIFYLHDKPTLAESKAIWKMTSEAWGVSTDGGQTWNGGMTVDGDTIVRILNAVGVNATWINTGAITVKDANENILFQVDMDTKTVVIDPDVLIIGNMTLSEKLENMDENIASAKNMTFQLSNDMQTITSDADGNIPVFPTVTTTAKVMYGSSDITNDCSYTITKSDSVTGSWDVDTHTYTVTGLSADNGWVDIKATYLINLSITKRFTISKQKSGKNGKQLYTWRKYASMPDGSDMSDSPDYVKLLDSAESPILDSTGDEIYTVTEAIYVGIADNKTTETPSDNPKDYIWSRFRGEDGADGIGIPGENGETSYIHTAYANSIDGTVDFSTTDTDRIYIGHYSDFEKTDSADPAKYTWARMRGEDGPPGRTYYLRANTEILLMGQDKKVSPEKLTVNVYYRDGQGEETAYAGWWKAERSSDSGKTWTTITLNQTEATGACTITSSLQIIGSRGMIRVTCYLDQAKTSIADMQTYSVALDVASLTQTEIVEILSDNGKWKGLYYKNGQLYISFNAALGGELTLGGANNGNGKLVIRDSAGNQVGYIDNTGVNFTKGTFSGSLNSADGTFTGELSANTGNIAGWVLDNLAEQLISPNGIIILDAQNEEVNINGVTLSAYGNGLVIDGGLNIICGTEDISDGTDQFQIFNLNTLTTGNYLRIFENGVYMSSSSSKRYKILGSEMSKEFLDNLYNITPRFARYKDGYLSKDDERVNIEFPMFIAEDVEKYFPLATDHVDGQVENWNERIMIPAMFAMIKSQKEQLDRQEKLINQLYEKLNIEKEN